MKVRISDKWLRIGEMIFWMFTGIAYSEGLRFIINGQDGVGVILMMAPLFFLNCWEMAFVRAGCST